MSESGKTPHAALSGCAINSCTQGWREIQDKQQCVMDVQDEYVDGGSLEVTMQN